MLPIHIQTHIFTYVYIHTQMCLKWSILHYNYVGLYVWAFNTYLYIAWSSCFGLSSVQSFIVECCEPSARLCLLLKFVSSLPLPLNLNAKTTCKCSVWSSIWRTWRVVTAGMLPKQKCIKISIYKFISTRKYAVEQLWKYLLKVL